jgi:LPXTG-motif cell wall-anchored protein
MHSHPGRTKLSAIVAAAGLVVAGAVFVLLGTSPAGAIAPPTVTMNVAASQPAYTAISPIMYDVVFSEPVTGFDSSDVNLFGTALPTTAVVTGSGANYTVAVSGMSQIGLVQADILDDAANAVAAPNLPNDASTSTNDDVVFYPESATPGVTIEQPAGELDPDTALIVSYAVTFSEPVTGFDASDIVLSGTAVATAVADVGPSVDGVHFDVSVTGMSSSGTVIASIVAGAALSVALNAPTTASTSVDNQVTFVLGPVFVPSVTIDQAAGQADPTAASPVLFTAIFDGSVTGFTASDVVLGGTAGATTAAISGSGPNYTIAVSGMTHSGTVTASIPADAAQAVAIPTAGNTASTSTDNQVDYIFTPTPLTVTVNQDVNQNDPSDTSPLLFDVTFSRPVTGFADNDVNVTGTADFSGWGLTGSGASYVLQVVGMQVTGTVIVDIPAGGAQAIDDGTTNDASTSTDNVVHWFKVSGVAPLVTVNQAVSQADPTSGTTVFFDVEFDQPVVGFDASSVILSGTADPSTVMVSSDPLSMSYTIAVSGMTQDGTVIATVAAGAVTAMFGFNDPNDASTSTDNRVSYGVEAATVSGPSHPSSTLAGADLPMTGANVAGLPILGLGLALAGVGLLVLSRRRCRR